MVVPAVTVGRVTVAALYVDPAGVYSGLPDVEVWGESRDARLYAGPWPVVAHPPCASWSIMGNCRPELVKGEDGGDGGCFAAALAAVRRFGGVLEHPAHSRAWKHFDLPYPSAEGWMTKLVYEGWACEVDQRNYGHRANKRTWLYYIGAEPPTLRWGRGSKGEVSVRSDGGGGRAQRGRTPAEFRDVLLDMARSASVRSAA